MTDTTSKTAQAHIAAGVAHHAAGRLDEAEAAMREAARLAPRNVEALSNLGAILRALGRPLEALEAQDAALAIDPASAAARLNRANVLNDLRRWSPALESASQALAAAPDNPAAHNARGNALAGLGRPREAVAAYRAALAIAPHDALARFNMANALLALGETAAALDAYDAALALRPDLAAAHAGRGHALAQQKRWAPAAAAYERAFALAPNLPYLAGQRWHARMKTCDWRDFDALAADLAARIEAGEPAATPMTIVATPLSARQQQRCATTYAANFRAAPRPPGAAPGPRLRIGYFSADFHEHATAHLMAEMLELHDRAAFEINAFSFGPASDSPMRARLVAACERFFDIRALQTDAVRDMSRQLGLDIAVDLKGFTAQARPEIFAAGVAPIQVSFLGYPMTSGADFLDYIVADRVIIAPADRELYSERTAWLPGAYQPTDRRRAVASRTTSRADHGLPAEAFVFASFNASYKITPAAFRVWMDLLRAIPGAVLWLSADDPAAADNLCKAAAAAGIAPARLIFAPFQPQAEHLKRIGHADLFLDSFPCTAHTTASDALWAGLPLVTLKGETFAGRVAASLLTAAGLPELVTDSVGDYAALALALARDPARLASLRARLTEARKTSALFDTPTYVRNLEQIYQSMHARRLAGLAPAHLP